MLAFKREGYSWFDISVKDLFEVVKYPGFWKLAAKYLRYGSSEMIRSIIISLSGKINICDMTEISIVEVNMSCKNQALLTYKYESFQ